MKALQHQPLYNVGENKKKEVLQHEKVLWVRCTQKIFGICIYG